MQVFRAQTAPATVYTLTIPYLLSGGSDLLVFLLLFAVGHILHFFSFGHNSIMDYWHDLKDPSKQHHPLVSGKIKLETAHRVIHTGLALTALILIIIVFIFSRNPVLPLLSLMLYLVFGHAYNDGLDHSIKHSWIPISLCFTFLSGVGWLMVSEINTAFILLLLWAFFTVFYQIAFEGNLKDLWNQSEIHNPLRKYAEYIYNPPYPPYLSKIDTKISLFFFLIRYAVNTSILILLSVELKVVSIVVGIMLAVFTVIELDALTTLHFKKHVSRDELLKNMGIAEAFEFFRLISLLGLIAIPIIIYGLTWFILMNKLLWGTRFGPRV